MAWNKVRLQLDDFMTPKLKGIVEYSKTGYRYTPSKGANCYLTVNKIQVMSQTLADSPIKWYVSEQEAKSDETTRFMVTDEEIEVVRQKSGGKIPEDRLEVIALGNKKSQYAKEVMKAQTNLSKLDFQKAAGAFLTANIDQSLESDDMIMNILAILDRRVGKKRLEKMKAIMMMKHPAVRYFYELRLYGRV